MDQEFIRNSTRSSITSQVEITEQKTDFNSTPTILDASIVGSATNQMANWTDSNEYNAANVSVFRPCPR